MEMVPVFSKALIRKLRIDTTTHTRIFQVVVSRSVSRYPTSSVDGNYLNHELIKIDLVPGAFFDKNGNSRFMRISLPESLDRVNLLCGKSLDLNIGIAQKESSP